MILVSKIQMAAMRRDNIPKDERKETYLYIDEFQNYVTDSIESILSEARKYRLSLNIAHQYLGQLEQSDALTKSSLDLKKAIFGNV
jgi:type IV secretory pathway TraG/TraD family ATPase VirD4